VEKTRRGDDNDPVMNNADANQEPPTATTRAAQKARLRRIRYLGLVVALLLSLPLLILQITMDKDLLEQVRDRGVLNVVTINGPTTYYRGTDGNAGFEYDLASAFAGHLDVELNMVEVGRIADLLPEVLAGRADLAAAGLAITEERKKLAAFSVPYQTIQHQVVIRAGSKSVRQVEDLVGRDILVAAATSHVERLEALRSDHPDLRWRVDDEATPENLLVRLAENGLDITVANSDIVSLVRQYYPELKIVISLPPPFQVGWVFAQSNDTSLLEAANDFLTQFRKSGELDVLVDRYYGSSGRFDYVSTTTFLEQAEALLPTYADQFRRAARLVDMDWRLLAAMAYQESHWNPDAVSPTGVRGIMMLTRDTAEFIGIEDRRDPEQSIAGGARYIRQLIDRLPERIKQPDRTWLALAAYNVGMGHLEDARILTQKAGRDPDLWLDVQQFLPRLADPEWHKQTRHGYARGYEPVVYVNRIRGYYEILAWYDDRTKDPVEVINRLELPAL